MRHVKKEAIKEAMEDDKAAVPKHLTVKELPDSERPYEKCIRYGPQYLSDAELLAVFLRTGMKGKTSVELAQQFLAAGSGSLLNLYDYSYRSLIQIPGIGSVKAVQLKCIAEISRRIAATVRIRDLCFDDPGSVAGYYMEKMRHEKKEQFVVCMLDSKCGYLGDSVLTVGSVNASLVSPRDVFIQALQEQAVSIIILHNHPSGKPQPSREDYRVTECIAACGKMLQITLTDHIIIGDNNYYSFREKGLL